MVLFLPLPCFRQYNPSSFFACYSMAPSVLRVAASASNLQVEGSTRCWLRRCPGCRPRHRHPRAALLANCSGLTLQAVGSSATTLKKKDVMGVSEISARGANDVTGMQLQQFLNSYCMAQYPSHFLTVTFSMPFLIIP